MIDTSPFELGRISIESRLPKVFSDEEVRALATQSLADFRTAHNKELPLKFRIEEFCFQRSDQICTVDSPRKYIAWAGSNTEVTERILKGLTVRDTSLALRSHPMEFGMQSPTIHIGPDDILEYLQHLADPRKPSKIANDFFDKLDLSATVIQLIKNPYSQSGLFLCRPTFVYDGELSAELAGYAEDTAQFRHGDYFNMSGVPKNFVGFRILPLIQKAREKKERLGAIFIYNHTSGNFEIKGGFPLEARLQIEGEFSRKGTRNVVGRSVNYDRNNATFLHYDDDLPKHSSALSGFLTDADLAYLSYVLKWQLPRIFAFEEEIRQQHWIPQGLSNTHQFAIFPPSQPDQSKIDTQYYDFRPHHTVEEMEILARERGQQFASMPTADKLRMFF